MKYFAYGSNLSIQRIRARTPKIVALGTYTLRQHLLKFHKASHDGSGKCDAYFTGRNQDCIYGILYEVNDAEKAILDDIEGKSFGYEQKWIRVRDMDYNGCCAFTYYATDIDPNVKPYDWYHHHVLTGAEEAAFPEEYCQQIRNVMVQADSNKQRKQKEMALYLST